MSQCTAVLIYSVYVAVCGGVKRIDRCNFGKSTHIKAHIYYCWARTCRDVMGSVARKSQRVEYRGVVIDICRVVLVMTLDSLL